MLRELLVAFCMVAVCVVIHIIGIVLLTQWLLGRRDRFVAHPTGFQAIFMLIMVFCIIIVMSMTETCVWAMLYVWWGLFPNFETSLYFSLTCYTTIGHGDILLPQNWRLLGGIEGISGVLLCGLSTAYIFVILNLLLRPWLERRVARRQEKVTE